MEIYALYNGRQATFNAELNKTMQNAKQGDVFDFMQVKVRCSFEHNYPICSLKYVVKN